MKKTAAIIVLLVFLVFSFESSAFASVIYSDIIFGATSKTGSTENDLAGHMIGIDVPMNDYSKFIMEYSELTVKSDNDATTTGLLIKSGLELIENDTFQTYFNLSSFMIRGDSATLDATYYPILLGLEFRLNFSERTYINGSYDHSICGKYKMDNSQSLQADYGIASMKWNYRFNEHNGVAFGYHWSDLKLSQSVTTKTINKGFSFGLTYQF